MGEQSRVLTVTFGTFSCTLQGFDDPFPILRQIADYFSEISRRDPTFGTQTGMVNADALAAIAAMTGAEAEWTQEGDLAVTAQDVAATSATVFAEPVGENDPIYDADKGVAQDEGVVEATDVSLTDETVEDNAILQDTVADQLATENEHPQEPAGQDVDAKDAEIDSTPLRLVPKTEEKVSETAEDAAPEADLSADTVADAVVDDLAVEPDTVVETDENVETEEGSGESVAEDEPADADISASDLPEWAADLIAEDNDEVDNAASTAATVDFEGDFEDAVEAAPSRTETDSELVAATKAPLVLKNIAAPDEAAVAATANPDMTKSEPAELPVVAGTETDAGTEPEPFEDPSKEYGKKTVQLAFGQKPGLDQSRAVELVAPKLPEEALKNSGLFEEFDDSEEATFAFTQGMSEPQADAPVPPKAEPAPAPLVLTEAIQTPAEAPAAPLQLDVPLRAEEAIADGSSDSLRDFATRAGAATLPDLLEASAAFVTLVNGRPSFSRGEIMRLVDTFAEDGGFSQEARIKSFGALIRGGRIQRTDTGDFEISRAARASYETAAVG